LATAFLRDGCSALWDAETVPYTEMNALFARG
jgi:hypothetical protein